MLIVIFMTQAINQSYYLAYLVSLLLGYYLLKIQNQITDFSRKKKWYLLILLDRVPGTEPNTLNDSKME